MSAPPTYGALPPELDPRRPRHTVLPQPPVQRRRRPLRLLRWVAALTSLVVLLGTVAGYVAYRHYDSNIARIRDFVIKGHTQPPPSGNAQNILLVGSDTREGYTPEQLKAAGTEFDAGARSDTVILAHIPGDGSRATLVSFPRDSYVQIPEWTAPDGKVYAARMRKLNYAFSEGVLPGGNPGLLVATVENLSGLRIDHYVQIDFLGFQKMVDALGGIDVCLRKDAKDKFSGINLTAGVHHNINGKVALAFVRQRHGLANADFDRIKRQQYFIGAVMRKVTSAGTLLNPLKLSAFLERGTASVAADEGLSFSELRTLALRLRNLDAQHVAFVTLPFTDAYADKGVAGSVVLLDEPRMNALFASLRGDRPQGSATPSPAGPRLVVPPSSITVKVYNGTSTAGLAGRASADLRTAGFNVRTPGTRSTGATSTVIRYGTSRVDSARTLAAAVPGAVLVEDATLGGTLELVVGSSYAGARAVQVAPSTPATPSAAPSVAASPPPVNAAADLTCAP